jgi:hypothetical protein
MSEHNLGGVMAFIPKGAVWYIAQIVLEIRVEGDARNVVHINYMLVHAESPDEAYEKALRLGFEHESTYLNRDKKRVQISFAGLRNLNIIYDELENGAELLYEEQVGVGEEQLRSLTRPKESFAVFKPIEVSRGPNYASAEIQQEAIRIVEGRNSGVGGDENQ